MPKLNKTVFTVDLKEWYDKAWEATIKREMSTREPFSMGAWIREAVKEKLEREEK